MYNNAIIGVSKVFKWFSYSMLLISSFVVASDSKGISFLYDKTTNTEWMLGEQRFSNLIIDAPSKNYVFYGKFSSDFDINVKANNLIIIGSLLAVRNIYLTTSKDFFNAGSINAVNAYITAEDSLYNGLSDQAIARIQALGIDMCFANAERSSLTIKPPYRILP